MERLLNPDQVAEIMVVNRRKASYIMKHEMEHMDKPLRVKEQALRDYIESKMVYPVKMRKVTTTKVTKIERRRA